MKHQFKSVVCLALIILQVCMCVGGLASSSRYSEDDVFFPELANQYHYSMDKWLRNAENRAILTVCLTLEYSSSFPQGAKCNLDKPSFVAENSNSIMVFVASSVTGTYLMLAYNPDAGVGLVDSFEWGDYDASLIRSALSLIVDGEVFINDTNEVANALYDNSEDNQANTNTQQSSNKTSTSTKSGSGNTSYYYNPKANSSEKTSSGNKSSSSNKSNSSQSGSEKVTYYNPNANKESSTSTTTTTTKTTTNSAASKYKLKTLKVSFTGYKDIKRYSANNWYESSERRALLTSFLDIEYITNVSNALETNLIGGYSYVGRTGTGSSTIIYVLMSVEKANTKILFEFNPSKKTVKYAQIAIDDRNETAVMDELCGDDYYKNDAFELGDQFSVAMDYALADLGVSF